MEPPDFGAAVAGLAALDEPVRRALYFHVASADGDVTRDAAAQAVGISRTLAGFHLDRLAREGLLDVTFRRLSGRSGPGAGRPAKLYRRSGRELAVSLPPRRYELAARLLAAAVDGSERRPAESALRVEARAAGKAIGDEARQQAGRGSSARRQREAAVAALAAHGYAPVLERGTVRLRNCPFHALVGEHRDLVCGMNLALVQGVIEGLGLESATADLDPQPGLCCVAIRTGRARRK